GTAERHLEVSVGRALARTHAKQHRRSIGDRKIANPAILLAPRFERGNGQGQGRRKGAPEIGEKRRIPRALALARIKINLQSASARDGRSFGDFANYLDARRKSTAGRFEPDYRHERSAGRVAERLQTWARRHVVAIQPHSAREKCDARRARLDEAQIFRPLPGP